jgi:hypothetical protein
LAVTTETLLGVATPWIAADPLEELLLLLALTPLLLVLPTAVEPAELLEPPHPASNPVMTNAPPRPYVLNRSLFNFMSNTSAAAMDRASRCFVLSGVQEIY